MKAQINPHFLFNTLNGIYSLALEKSDVTANAIAQLSGMMRYITSEAGTDFVPLEKELNYIQNYIELQKIRFGNTVLLDFQIHNQSKNQKIAPLILITFIENAFKYGVNPEEESHILIQITIENAKLEMQIINKKVEIQPAKATATSLGIINTQKRLEYLYPGQYDLSIKEKDHHYHVFLNLNL
ncbi:MAG: sensor histidine kinase [Saprospiraceae bacterium]|nr:sensor histidine kinase [Saprospiraceae bacterium]